jgi:hypothetical protein
VENKIQFARKILHGDNNKQLLKPTTSKDNQEEKENLGYENFDNAANPLMLFNCSAKEVPIQEPFERQPTSCHPLLFYNKTSCL